MYLANFCPVLWSNMERFGVLLLDHGAILRPQVRRIEIPMCNDIFSHDSIIVLKDATLLVARKVDLSVGPGSSHSSSNDNSPLLELSQ